MDRDRLLARVSFLAEVLAVLEQHVVLPPVAIPDIPGVGDDGHVAERAAAQVRKLWGLGQGPIDHVVRLLETKGVVVVRPNVEAREVDAFSTGITVRPIVVLASDKHDAARSRMDAAHELGHLVMHHDAEPGRQSIEREAKRFAAAFLLPAEPLLRELPRRRLHWDAYFDLKARWRVSIQALLYRARTLGALSPDSYQRAQVQLSARGWRQHEPVDLGAPEEPQLLQRALRLLASQREMTAAQVAASIHIYEDDFESLLADVGPPISPPPAPALKVIGVDEVGG